MVSTAINFRFRAFARTQAEPVASGNRKRHISADAGHALEVLGHAIEYLTDEYVQSAKQFSSTDPQVAAVQLLMALNRQIYYECPVVPTFAERLRILFHIHAH